MIRFRFEALRCLVRTGLCAALFGLSVPVFAGPISFDTWSEFSFGDVGTLAAGCDPADPAGAFCIPSSGTPTVFLDAPAWTFVAPLDGATLTVVDAFSSGDRFQLFDAGLSIGFTSLSAVGTDCGDDPVACLADANMSRGIFSLGAGAHSLTLIPSLLPEFSGGSGYLRITAGGGPPTTSVSEPGPLMLFAAALAIVLLAIRMRSKARKPFSAARLGAA